MNYIIIPEITRYMRLSDFTYVVIIQILSIQSRVQRLLVRKLDSTGNLLQFPLIFFSLIHYTENYQFTWSVHPYGQGHLNVCGPRRPTNDHTRLNLFYFFIL
jgi:hypothetical protein